MAKCRDCKGCACECDGECCCYLTCAHLYIPKDPEVQVPLLVLT